jgi:OOP family OmpA-OmpF porin
LRNRIASLIVVSIVAGATQVFAQGANPSADQIIKSLTPSGDVSHTTTRGIRMAPQAAPAEGGASVTGATPEARKSSAHPVIATGKPTTAGHGDAMPAVNLPAVNLTVNFATGSAELTPQAIQTLDALGTALSSEALSHYRFRVEGHTDTIGTPETNHVLSERRAEAVVSYIESKFGVPAARLEAIGMGSEKPLIPTGPQVPEPRNRRVQVINLG